METIAQAYIKFQSEVEPISKSKTAQGQKFSYSYADFAEIVEDIKPFLSKHGLAFRQKSIKNEDWVSVQTILVHISGEEWDCGTVTLPIVDRNPQKIGALVTYCRRYSLTTGLGIVVSDSCEGDNDARDHIPTPPQSPSKGFQQQSNRDIASWEKMASENAKMESNAMKRFFSLANKRDLSDKQQKAIIYYFFDENSRKDVTDEQYKALNEWLDNATRDDIKAVIEEAKERKLAS